MGDPFPQLHIQCNTHSPCRRGTRAGEGSPGALACLDIRSLATEGASPRGSRRSRGPNFRPLCKGTGRPLSLKARRALNGWRGFHQGWSILSMPAAIPGLSHSHSDVASADLMGSIEVYRYSPDDPVALNLDWSRVITFASSDSMLLVRGPISDSDHWRDKIPGAPSWRRSPGGSTKSYRSS